MSAWVAVPLWTMRLASLWGLLYGPADGFWTFVSVFVGAYAAVIFLSLPDALQSKNTTGPVIAAALLLWVALDLLLNTLLVLPTHALLVAFGVIP